MIERDSLNRRDVLKAAGVAAAAIVSQTFPLGWTSARAEDAKPKKVLMFTKSQGFEHSTVHRKSPDQLSYAEQLATDWGKEHGFEVTATKDGSKFTPEFVNGFDAFLFYTQGDLFETGGRDKTPGMTPEGKEALLKAVADGKGFIGFHCASDTFHSKGDKVDPYIEMLGGEFVVHHAQQDAHIIVTDKNFGPIKDLEDFTLMEEWYILKNFAPDLHVIGVQVTQSMREESYRKLKNYPETWARMHGKGRVFFSSMGHREDVWQKPVFQKVFLGGMAWVLRNADADVKPNLKEVCPEAEDRTRKGSAA